IFESLDLAPQEALLAAGAGRLGLVLFAILPQAWPLLLSYTLYSWECCMRAAAVMGFVGGGGLGYQIDLSMQMFKFHQVSTLILALLLLIGLVDLFSFAIRRLLDLRETPRHPRVSRWLQRGAMLAIGALLVSGFWANRQTLTTLANPANLASLGSFAAGFFRPDLQHSALRAIPRLAAETFAVSVAGTALGGVLGLALALPGARTLTFDGPFGGSRSLWLGIYQCSRLVQNALRAVPEVLWALIFVLSVGLGPFSGMLAIGVHTGGVLGKLFAEAFEAIDARPLEALVGAGCSRLGAICFAVWPQALPVVVSYILMRWDMNLRVAAILGFVGAGGLGQEIWNDIQLLLNDRLLPLIMAILIMVWLGDRLSATLRRRLAV
ncbi:MAG: ABC transporter permease subunit, partial [Cyanobacteria bacterium REEB65]|nr:ABC transporter permease subunit [Cyanobacteria bacterium REEB65]